MDRLTFFNETQITYDAIGNPLSYYNGSSYTFTWNGRRLTGAIKGSSVLSFTYNDEGIRTSKTVNGVTTTYYLNGSQIVGENRNGDVIVYIYDAQGMPIGMQYHEATAASDAWEIYWYERNLQGDIIAVYDEVGVKLASYVYDAWVGEIKQLITVLSKPKPPKATSARSERTERHGATMRRWRAKILQQLTTTAVQIYLKL